MRLIAPAIAVSLLMLLTACDPGGSDPAPPASSEPSESATVEPVVDEEAEAEPEAATILFRTESFAILDEDDVTMQEFDYFDSPAEAISALTEVFGGAPVVTPFEGHTHQEPGNYYAWDAFTLIDYDAPAVAYGEEYGVASSAAVVRGLTVETVADLTVGSTAAAAIAAGGSEQGFSYDGMTAAWIQLDIVAGTDPEWLSFEGGSRIFVHAALSGPGGTITILSAPVANYGP